MVELIEREVGGANGRAAVAAIIRDRDAERPASLRSRSRATDPKHGVSNRLTALTVIEVLDFAGSFEVFSTASQFAVRDGETAPPAFEFSPQAARRARSWPGTASLWCAISRFPIAPVTTVSGKNI